MPAEIYTYAFDEEGRIRDYFSQAVSLDLYKVGYRLDAGFKLLGHLRLLPGTYEIRTLVRNARTGDTGLAVTQIRVPDYGALEPALLPPFFIEPDDQWLVALAEYGEDSFDYPLMGGGRPLVPASRPRLVSGQRIPLLLVGHELPLEVEAEGHLIGSDGRIYRDVAVQLDRRGRAGGRAGGQAGGAGERLTAHLLASDVPPGDYRLVVTLRGDGVETSSSLPVTFIGL